MNDRESEGEWVEDVIRDEPHRAKRRDDLEGTIDEAAARDALERGEMIDRLRYAIDGLELDSLSAVVFVAERFWFLTVGWRDADMP